MRYVSTLLIFWLGFYAQNVTAQADINVLSNASAQFPPGCIALSLPEAPVSEINTLVDEVIEVPRGGGSEAIDDIRVMMWRVGCHDPGFSVIMVRLQNVGSGFLTLARVPEVYVEKVVDEPGSHRAHLISDPAASGVGATGEFIPFSGQTWMLAVDPIEDFVSNLFFIEPGDYNDVLAVELVWNPEQLVPTAVSRFVLPPYEPQFDPPQFTNPILHGRMSGQYTFDGVPATGLQVLVGEQSDGTNFVFAIFFTYLDGEPFWVVGSTGGEPIGIPKVELGMLEINGGSFFGLGPFSDSELEFDTVGSLSLEAIDCKTMRVGYDFSSIGGGTGVLEGTRFIDIAGYSCNPLP